MHAINFLTAVSRSVHYKLFEGADTLRQICESIVIPNLRMREDMVRALATASQAAMRCVCGGQEACVLPYRAATGHIRMCRGSAGFLHFDPTPPATLLTSNPCRRRCLR